MVNGIRIIYHRGLNKGFGSKFRIGSKVRQEKFKKEESAETL